MPIVAIGASAGGLEAVTRLLESLPTDTGMGFVLIQHLDPAHESALAQILARATRMPVLEVKANQRVRPDHVHVIPPNASLTIANGVLKLTRRPATRGAPHSIDVFFESLADDQGPRAIGIVLSGTSDDGTLGLEAIKTAGGITFAQDESARYDTMPRSAVAAGGVDLVLPPQGIARELARLSRHPLVVEDGSPPRRRAAQAGAGSGPAKPRSAAAGGAAAADAPTPADESAFQQVLELVGAHGGVDFTLYKSSTIRRRVARRAVLHGDRTVAEYAKFLRGNPNELDALYSDVLISVTSFFRNPEVFEALERNVFPRLVDVRRHEGPVRVWTLGCSMGQEAYSIAMVYAEFAERHADAPPIQIFATDLNESLLERARTGLYSKALLQGVSAERLRRFFVEEDGGHRVVKSLREQVVFARQNVASDPPFSRMDLISCRNLLIYLETELQKSILPAFHYALRAGGFLLLGASESVGPYGHLFAPVDPKHKIFARKPAAAAPLRLPLPGLRAVSALEFRAPSLVRERGDTRSGETTRREFDAQREADRALLGRFAPPGVLVNHEFQILQFRGATGPFLEPPTGRATFDVTRMAREGLMLPLRSALQAARRRNQPVRAVNVRVKQPEGPPRAIHLQVIPLKNLREPCYLVLFEPVQARASTATARGRSRPSDLRRDSRRIAELEREISETRQHLQTMQEDSEAATEELQASGQEVQSANEELQSINEELETSKEELESTNEELTTVNDELANRNTELSRALADLNNLQANLDTAILLFSRELTLRRFTAPAARIFNLLTTDVGRSISGIRHNLELPDLEIVLDEVIATHTVLERDARDRDGHWYALRARPYLNADGSLDGVVLVLTDITERKVNEEALARFAAAVDGSVDAILSLDLDGTITAWNRGAESLFGFTATEAIGQSIELIVPPERHGETRMLLARVGAGEGIPQFDTIRRHQDGTPVEVGLSASPIRGPDGVVVGISKIERDMGERNRVLEERERLLESEKQARDAAVAANEAKDVFLATLSHEVRTPLNAILGWASLLRASTPSPQDLKTGLEVIDRNCRVQARLIDDILDVSSILSGKLRLEMRASDLGQIVRSAADTVRSGLEAKEIDLQLDLDPAAAAVVCDPGRMQQAVWNLLTNAIKFTPRGGHIAVRTRRDTDGVRIEVSDSGKGIGAESLSVIFDRFRQVDGGDTRGLGLGLSIVKYIVEMHGGRAVARSDGPGLGSTFVLTPPIAADAATEAGAPPQPAAGTADEIDWSAVRAPHPGEPPIRLDGIEVIVADDEVDARHMLSHALEGAGAIVSTHPSAAGALAALAAPARGRSRVLISDIQMPDMSGLELIRQVRRRHPASEVPAIALTAFTHSAHRDEALRAGFQLHRFKPVDPRELISLVAGLVIQGSRA